MPHCPHIGIDLGTTYSCVAYVDEQGEPAVIRNSDQELTTPSVIWFDGKTAFVGKKANDRKLNWPQPIFERMKRYIGKPINPLAPNPYEIGGLKYGALGMSAILLRKLKKDAINHFKSKGFIETEATEQDVLLDAIITVPAHFGDKERKETQLAGQLAGLNVIHIVNEPTAAALTYGISRHQDQSVMVFDLGGGTLDITLLKLRGGESDVIASNGRRDVGGCDWDRLIESHIYDVFYHKTGRQIPPDMGYEIQQKALHAKFQLTEREETVVTVATEGEDCMIPLYRSVPSATTDEDELRSDPNRPFYFEQRATDLLTRCRALCEWVRSKAGIRWVDIDNIVLAGGACRMPMIPEMLDQLCAPKRVRRSIAGFSFDTAIAIGAAVYGRCFGRVRDVAPQTYGVKYKQPADSDHYFIDHLILKNSPLPCHAERETPAIANASMEIYEGNFQDPDECRFVGEFKLDNPQGRVKVRLSLDEYGLIEAAALWTGRNAWSTKIIRGPHDYDLQWIDSMRNHVQSIMIKM